MICENCQAEAQDFAFCPYCGYELRPHEPTPHDAVNRRARHRRLVRRWVMPVLLLLVVIAFGVLALALSGFRDGVQDRNLATQHQAEIHYNRGLIYLEWGQHQLAEAEFEEALRLVPNYTQAEDKRRVAQAKQTVTPTPTPYPSPTATATPVVSTPTPEVVVIPVAQVLFEEAQADYEKNEWAKAISTLEQLRSEDATYRTDEVLAMLFESHRNYGVELEEEGNLEEAISHYDSALYLRRRDPEVEEMRQRADLYIKAAGVWSVDWDRAIINLTALYALAPDYKDTGERLYQACTTAAEDMVKHEQYCAASELLEQALEISSEDPEIVQLEDDTHHLCQVAGSLPVQTPEPNGSATGQVHIGTIVASCYDHRENVYGLCAQNAEDNVLVPWIVQAEQPAVTLDGMALAYRSTAPDLPGLYATYLTPSTEISGTVVPTGIVTITVEASAHYPTWSPDGTRVAYVQYDADEEDWFVYIAGIGSTLPTRRVHQGEWPNWGPGGLLAFTTCSEEGECGIHVYDPASGSLRKVTNSVQDRASAWSPSGQEIAYMSDIGRSLNLYIVQRESGHVRQLTRNLFTDSMPVWSPDGQRIAYVTDRDDDWALYTLHAALGEDNRRLATLGAESTDWLRLRLSWVAPVIRLAATP